MTFQELSWKWLLLTQSNFLCGPHYWGDIYSDHPLWSICSSVDNGYYVTILHGLCSNLVTTYPIGYINKLLVSFKNIGLCLNMHSYLLQLECMSDSKIIETFHVKKKVYLKPHFKEIFTSYLRPQLKVLCISVWKVAF